MLLSGNVIVRAIKLKQLRSVTTEKQMALCGRKYKKEWRDGFVLGDDKNLFNNLYQAIALREDGTKKKKLYIYT